MKCVLAVASRADNADLQRDQLPAADGPARGPTEPAPGIYISRFHINAKSEDDASYPIISTAQGWSPDSPLFIDKCVLTVMHGARADYQFQYLDHRMARPIE